MHLRHRADHRARSGRPAAPSGRAAPQARGKPPRQPRRDLRQTAPATGRPAPPPAFRPGTDWIVAWKSRPIVGLPCVATPLTSPGLLVPVPVSPRRGPFQYTILTAHTPPHHFEAIRGDLATRFALAGYQPEVLSVIRHSVLSPVSRVTLSALSEMDILARDWT